MEGSIVAIKKILVVCNENVGRSPLLAAILAYRLRNQGIQVDSAGLIQADFKGFSPLSMKIIEGLKQKEGTRTEVETIVSQLKKHVPKQVTAELLQSADLILTMSPQQSKILVQRYQGISPLLAQKIFSVREFAAQKRLQGKPAKMRDTKGKPIGLQRKKNWSESLRVANRIIRNLHRK